MVLQKHKIVLNIDNNHFHLKNQLRINNLFGKKIVMLTTKVEQCFENFDNIQRNLPIADTSLQRTLF